MSGKQKLTIWFLGLILGLACLTFYGSSGAAESTQGPFNLVGWDSGRYVQLNWDAESEPMSGGYNIYRAVNAQDEWQKLNNRVFRSTNFVDHSAPRSGLILYRVNLVDSAGHELPSASVVQVSRTAAVAELSESSFALSHDQNSIINDSQLLNTSTMSAAQIQTFLSAQGSVLATYSSGGKTAAQRIFDDCQTHGINPQVVLVTLQKEKGIIKSSTGNPNSLAMGWNTSDSTTSDFASQIYFGTRQFRLYYDNLNNYGWSVGQPHNVSDGMITAASTATAGLYIYTPWIGSAVGIGGNYLFWDLWYKTFSFSDGQETSSAVADGFDFPVGATNGSGWLNNLNGLQFLDGFNYGGTCGFTFHPGHDFNKDGTSGDQDRFEPVYAVANGTVIKSAFFGTSTWGNVILIEHTLPDGTKVWSQYGHLEDRGVQDGAEVTRRQQIGRVGKGDGSLSAHLHFEMRKVNQSANAFPCGQSQVFVTDRYYNPIEYLNANRSLQVCNNNTAALLNRDGGPPIHPPGSLLKTSSSSTVYLIDPENRRRPITSGSVLAQLYNQSTDARTSTDFSHWVISVSQAELDLYEQGGNISAALPGNGKPFPDGKLISFNGQVSIITGGGKRRPFATENVFTGLGYRFCHVVNVSQSEYDSYPVGPPVEAMPLLTSSVNLSPSGPYSAGQSITGSFTIKNVGYDSITFLSLGIGGRFNSNVVHDMNFVSTTLAPGSSHVYSSNQKQLSNAGSYEFFAAYREPNDHWALSVPAAPGVVRRRQINVDGARPSPPTANPATNISSSGFTANWSSSSNATGYRLDVSTSSSFLSFVSGFQNLDVGNVLSRNVTGLTPGTTHFYRVRAYNSDGTSDNSGTISVTASVNPPSAPTANSATSVGATSFSANWNAATGAAGYRLDVSTSSSFSSFVSGFQNLDLGNVLSRNVTGLASGTTYFYRVRAYNSAGTSGNSGTISVTTSVNPPSAPTASSATNVGTTSFTANWSAASGAAGYRLDVSTSSSFSSFVSGFQNLDVGNVSSRNVIGLASGTTHFYRVRAYNSAGTSGNSGTIIVTTIVNPPGAPTANPATNVGTTSFTANWSAVTEAGGYRLDVSTSSSFSSFVIGYQNLHVGNSLSRSVTGLNPNTTYFYRVRAFNAVGTSNNSGTISVTTLTQNFTITVAASPIAGGTVIGGGTFAAGSSRTVVATANSGHTFTNWTENGNVVSTAASYSFVLNANRNLIATFVTTPVNGNASYDAFLKVPKCGQVGALCDSGALLNGRDSISGGQEPNQPNTINSSCPDNTAGNYHVDESVDRIKISTLDGSSFAPGKTVRIEISVWAFSATQDFLDLFYAPDANNPNWIYITTLVPAVTGAQVLTTTFTLANGGGLQAVRANFLFEGSPTACSGGASNFDDHDDLAFAVQNAPGSWQPHVLTSTAVTTNSWTINGRTFLYVKLNFPDSGFRISNWGSPVQAGNDFSVNALVERFSGASTQALSSTAQIYDLGFVPGGVYTFTFKNSGTIVKVSNFAVTLQPPPANPIDAITGAREFVRWQYKDFLRREPDGPGWDHWTSEITMCSDPTRRFPGESEPACIERKRANTSAAFFFSPEFQNTGYFVIRVYRGSLGRMPHFGGGLASDSEFTRDATTVAAGIVVSDALAPNVINVNKQAFVNEFVARSEFRAIYDTLNNTQFVDKLFQTTGVTPTSNARQSLIDGLNNGSETRTSVLFKVVDGTTTVTGGLLVFNTNYGKAFYDNLFNAAFVQMEYFGYLLRDPDPGGYNFWLDKLNHFGNWVDAQMVLAFISSPEYRARFGAP